MLPQPILKLALIADISNDENKRDRFNFVQADFTNISSFENLTKVSMRFICCCYCWC